MIYIYMMYDICYIYVWCMMHTYIYMMYGRDQGVGSSDIYICVYMGPVTYIYMYAVWLMCC